MASDPAITTIKLTAPERQRWEIQILYEDEHVLALNKPAGLLVAPDANPPRRPNLMHLLQEAIARGRPWVKERGITYLMNIHRLDLETSGVLLLGKHKQAITVFTRLFESKTITKEYIALVHGHPTAQTFEIELNLEPDPRRYGLMRPGKRGKYSHTAFELLERFIGYSLLRCRPTTGRSHQIRVHLQYAGLPIVGDEDYGGAPLYLSQLKPGYRFKPDQDERPLLGTVALHAEKLAFEHPLTGRAVEIVAPWPKHLEVAVKYLRRYAAV